MLSWNNRWPFCMDEERRPFIYRIDDDGSFFSIHFNKRMENLFVTNRHFLRRTDAYIIRCFLF